MKKTKYTTAATDKNNFRDKKRDKDGSKARMQAARKNKTKRRNLYSGN